MRNEAVTETVGRTLSELLRAGQSVTAHVATSSMIPMLRPGDELLIDPCDPGVLSWGHLVVFRSEADWIAHWLFRRTPNGWLTCGEAVGRFDGKIAPDQVMGVVVRVHRDNRSEDLRSARALLRCRVRVVRTVVLILLRHVARQAKQRLSGFRSSRLSGAGR